MSQGDKTLYGVSFTAIQWEACNMDPPLWHLHPPQREDYDSDHDYAKAERDYADRVIAATAEQAPL
jgi:hypothetical protein